MSCRDVFQHFGTENCIETGVFEGQRCCVALHTFDVWMMNVGFLKVQCHNLIKAFGKDLRKVAVACADVQCTPAICGHEFEQARDAFDFARIGSVLVKIDGHG